MRFAVPPPAAANMKTDLFSPFVPPSNFPLDKSPPPPFSLPSSLQEETLPPPSSSRSAKPNPQSHLCRFVRETAAAKLLFAPFLALFRFHVAYV